MTERRPDWREHGPFAMSHPLPPRTLAEARTGDVPLVVVAGHPGGDGPVDMTWHAVLSSKRTEGPFRDAKAAKSTCEAHMNVLERAASRVLAVEAGLAPHVWEFQAACTGSGEATFACVLDRSVTVSGDGAGWMLRLQGVDHGAFATAAEASDSLRITLREPEDEAPALGP